MSDPAEQFADYRIFEEERDGRMVSFMQLGRHHAPFRMRDEVSARVWSKSVSVARDDNDPMMLLRPFIVADDRDRLEQAMDDEEHPIVMGGIRKLFVSAQEKYISAPLGDG